MMRVTGLVRGRGKGQPPESLERWDIEAGELQEERQVSLLPRRARETVERMDKRGLCMKRFFANLEIEDLPPLESGQRLAVGDAVLEITQARKSCFAECPLAGQKAACPLQACRFARVIRGGGVSLGDQVLRLE